MSSPQDIVVVGKPKTDLNKLTLITNGKEFSGWEEIELTLRAEGFPPSFSVKASMPSSLDWPAREGQSCVVKLGDDTVITGYIDFVRNYFDANNHQIEISGRGKTQDLVDCGAEWESHQMVGGNAFTVAKRLAAPYNIDVVMVNGADPGPDISKWPLNYGETGADIIQRVARNAGLLAYEDHLGRLALAAVGSTVAKSGIAYGVNVEAGSVERSMDQRFSDYLCAFSSIDNQGAIGSSDFYYRTNDKGVPRHRLTYLVTEYVAADAQAFTQKRANWEASRRAGRSYVVNATVDSWRDDGDKLWSPNTLVPINLPGANTNDQWIIAQVTYRLSNERGTQADIIAMAPTAFTPEPIVLVPVNTEALKEVTPANAQ